MTNLVAMTVKRQLADVRELLDSKSWKIKPVDDENFIVTMTASDKSLFALHVVCKQYPVFPPAFHWCDPETGKLDDPENTPAANGGFFHPNGVICAPWNRLAYTGEDRRGPHKEWMIGNWLENSYTKGCKTIAAMLMRIDHELKYKFKGRMKDLKEK